MNKQREALEMALEALEQYGTSSLNNEDAYSAAINAIREALAEPEQEPVAWTDDNYTNLYVSKDIANAEGASVALYVTLPAQKPLTDNKILQIAKDTQTAEPGRDGYILPIAFARAIERALRASEDE